MARKGANGFFRKVLHLNDVVFAILGKEYVRLDDPRAGTRIAQPGPRIQVLDDMDGDLDVLHGPPQHLGDFLVLAGLHEAQTVGDNLPGHAAAPVNALDLQ